MCGFSILGGNFPLSFLSFYHTACSQKNCLTYPDEKLFFHCVDSPFLVGIFFLSFLSFYHTACSQKKLLTYPDEKLFFHCVHSPFLVGIFLLNFLSFITQLVVRRNFLLILMRSCSSIASIPHSWLEFSF